MHLEKKLDDSYKAECDRLTHVREFLLRSQRNGRRYQPSQSSEVTDAPIIESGHEYTCGMHRRKETRRLEEKLKAARVGFGNRLHRLEFLKFLGPGAHGSPTNGMRGKRQTRFLPV